MNTSIDNSRISSKIDIEYPDFDKLPAPVREKFEAMPTKVNFFKMLGHSAGTFVPIIDLTNAIFKDLAISDYYKELAVLLVAAHGSTFYEWEQHVTIAQVAGVRQDQFVAIAENQLNDTNAFDEKERVFLRFVKAILENGKAPAVLLKHALEYFPLQELADAMIVLGYYRMLAGFINTFDIAVDPQKDGSWVKG
ncbi:MAG: carboxymuconolactone decarboxylase [Alphaproteobacteria bacterium]|nr:MAG: carboxymuconolactone decarboxylase [Alphaproteobacteria bacterium]